MSEKITKEQEEAVKYYIAKEIEEKINDGEIYDEIHHKTEDGMRKNKPPFCYYCGEEVEGDHEEYGRVAHGDCIDGHSDDDLFWEVLD